MNEIKLVLKITGTKENIAALITHLEAQYYIVHFSNYKPNSDDNEFHRYATLISKTMLKTEVEQ